MKFNVSRLIAGAACVLMLTACKDSPAAGNATAAPAANGPAAAVASAPAPAAAQGGDVKQIITNALKRARPELEVADVKPAAIPNLYSVRVTGGPTLYATADGTHFIAGELYEVTSTELVNVTEQERAGERKDVLASVPRDQTINFTPANTKGTAYVFTDVDCFYCQKLHHGMAKMNELGIEIRYLAYPRAGIGSPSYKKIVSAWCSDNKQEAINKLKNREEIPLKDCKDNPVAGQFELGEQLGVHGTPAIFLADGTAVPGYVPPEELAKRLGIH
jgi:thiol:disulfide interchange protein DsbC